MTEAYLQIESEAYLTLAREVSRLREEKRELVEELENLHEHVRVYWGWPKSGATYPKYFDAIMLRVNTLLARVNAKEKI